MIILNLDELLILDPKLGDLTMSRFVEIFERRMFSKGINSFIYWFADVVGI
jgi:hypothetical protein